MPSLVALRDRLPSLYRPEDGDTGVLAAYLGAVAAAVDALDLAATEVMQAHWLAYADRPDLHPFLLRQRALEHLPAPNRRPFDPARPPSPEEQARRERDVRDVESFPYLDDLARMAALLPLLPWRDSVAQQETVEAFRRRIGRTVALYRRGLGTVAAVRGMASVLLPEVAGAPPERRQRPLWLEEFAPIAVDTLDVRMPGPPDDLVGPLMRWELTNPGLAPVAPTLIIQGIEAIAGEQDATERPLIELYGAAGRAIRVGIGYRGTVPPGQALRLRPAFASWLGRADGLHVAESRPAEGVPADPTAPGPWQPAAGAPAGTVTALVQTHDHALWVATAAGAAGALHRFDGQGWQEALSGLGVVHCLAEDGDTLLLGTEQGARRMLLFPEAGAGFAPAPVSGLDGQAVHALLRDASGRWWAGAAGGALRQGPDGTFAPAPLQGTAVRAIHADGMGTLQFGTDLGLFAHQPAGGGWHWYAGNLAADEPPWQPLRPDAAEPGRNFPVPERVFIPPVHAVRRGPDGALWLGTARGIACLTARPVDESLASVATLEAFPELLTGAVHAISQDERGLMWFTTERGLFRHDGRDWWQAGGGAWMRLGNGALVLGAGSEMPRGDWLFHRDQDTWLRIDPRPEHDHRPLPFTGELVSTDEAAVRAVAWTDGVVADTGVWDGAELTGATAVAAGQLLMRLKPREDRIVSGGVPAVPRLPPGVSVWRYLTVEPEPPAPPDSRQRPWWTVEGRLIPPPDVPVAPPPGRYDQALPSPASVLDMAAFAYPPAARLRMAWAPRRAGTLLVRLKLLAPDEQITPAVLDRVWQGIRQARPAGVRAALAVEETVVREDDHGSDT